MLSSPLSPSWQLLLWALSAVPREQMLALPVVAPDDWDLLFAECRRHGLFPLINRALQQLSSELFPDVQRNRFRAAAAACMLRSDRMQRELQHLQALFALNGVPVIPFKGPVLAERAYGDVGLRVFNDLDLLVPEGCVAAAIDLLTGQGYRLMPGVDTRDLNRLVASTNEVGLEHPSAEWLVEVHWAFAKPWQRLRFPLDAIWNRVEPSAPGGHLDDATTLLQLCVHGTSHYWEKLKWVVDVDRLVRAAPDLKWPLLLAQAREIGCLRALLLGLSLAHDLCGLPLATPVAEEASRHRQLPWLKRFAAAGWRLSGERKRSRWGRALFILRCRPGFRARLRVVSAFLAK